MPYEFTAEERTKLEQLPTDQFVEHYESRANEFEQKKRRFRQLFSFVDEEDLPDLDQNIQGFHQFLEGAYGGRHSINIMEHQTCHDIPDIDGTGYEIRTLDSFEDNRSEAIGYLEKVEGGINFYSNWNRMYDQWLGETKKVN